MIGKWKGRRVRRFSGNAFVLVMLAASPGGAARAQESPEVGERCVQAVRTFADNVLEHGRDRYGPRHTPLLVDGLHIDTHEPAVWKLDGQQWILSNLASQQNFLRTLDALTRLTGEARYHQSAVEVVRYGLDHLRSDSGLLYWGGHCAYDAGTEQLVGERHGGREKRLEHELKRHYPYYELMWEVDPEATKKYIKAFWNAHIVDWSTLCMNRHGRYDRPAGPLWAHAYAGGPVFFPCEGLTFVSTGSDLYYAAALLARFTRQEEPLVWAKRMARRYVETRNPRTGLPGYQYTQYADGDRAKEQFGPEWGERILEGTLLMPDLSARQFGDASVSELLLGERLGEAGKEFLEWGLADLAAYAKHAYHPDDNTFATILTDGTRLGPGDVKRKGYFGPPGSDRFKPRPADADMLRAYALAWRLSGDAGHWATARSIARGIGLGDIGASPEDKAELNLSTDCDQAGALLAVLEVYERQRRPGGLDLARRIAGNILARRFQKGFFVHCENCVISRFDAVEPLVLLRLAAVERGQAGLVPTVWPGKSYFHCTYDGMGRTYDHAAIYSQRRK